MLAAVIGFAAAALAFAGVAVALAVTGGKSLVSAGKKNLELTSTLRETLASTKKLQESFGVLSNFRDGDKKTIEAQKREIDHLRKLLREHAPDGVVAEQFDWLLQEASGQDGDGDGDEDGGSSDPVL